MARKTSTVTISDGRVVPIRQLGWLQLRASQSAAQQESARNLVAMGGAEFMAAWDAMRNRQDANKPLAVSVGVTDEGAIVVADGHIESVPVADVLNGHDLFTVLRSGIPTFSQDQVEELLEVDAELLGREILALTPTPRTPEQEKNGASPSIGA
jgi:hypothetical protein